MVMITVYCVKIVVKLKETVQRIMSVLYYI